MTAPVLHFMIVGQEDHPIFEADLISKSSDASGREERPQYLYHFVLHAALDAVEEQEWSTNSMHLGVVDRFNNYQVSAFTTAAHIKFLLLHDGRGDEVIRNFFKDVYEIYIKIMLNPFFISTAKITSSLFQQRVKALGRQYFR